MHLVVLALVRAGAVVLATALTVPGLLIARAFPARLRYMLTRTISRTWAATVCSILGISVSIDGPKPPDGSVVVSNHLGYLDVPVLMGTTGARFVAKSDVNEWPVIGFLVRLADTLFIDRRNARDLSRINEEMNHVQSRGESVVFFPEGTSSGGDVVLPFYSGLFLDAARRGQPVYAAAIRYHVRHEQFDARTDVCWWGGMTLMDHLYRLMHIPRIQAQLVFSATPIRSDDRKQLALRLHSAVCTGLNRADQLVNT